MISGASPPTVATTSCRIVPHRSREVLDQLEVANRRHVHSGTPGALTEIACNDDDSNSGLLSAVCVDGLSIGQTYYIQAASFSADDTGEITVDVVRACKEGCRVLRLADDALDITTCARRLLATERVPAAKHSEAAGE